MPLFQPPVPPLPKDLDLRGLTVIVTGASSGLGLEFSRQLLVNSATSLILAVRNLDKGKVVKAQLLTDALIQKTNPNATITVMELNLESFRTVRHFATLVKKRFSRLDIMMLNAGIGCMKREVTADGHEKHIQVNYLSNVLLLFELLPLLEATSTQTGQLSKVVFTGSRMHESSHLIKFAPSKQVERMIKYLDSPQGYDTLTRYGDSKLLLTLFLYELKKRYSPRKVIVNEFCPGMVATNMDDSLPWYIKYPFRVIKAIRARKVEQGGWIGLNAACVAGTESHGQLLADMTVLEPIPFATSQAGLDMQRRVWNETIEEMRRLIEVPRWC